MNDLSHKNLELFIKTEIIKNFDKVKGKHANISEIVNNISKSLIIEKIYNLSEKNKYFYLFIAKNYFKTPKLRYFLTVSIANNSSDFLVQLAKDLAIKNDLKLIQYSIFPKTLRIQLLLIKEIKEIEDYTNFIKKLKLLRREFRNKLEKIRNLIENK